MASPTNAVRRTSLLLLLTFPLLFCRGGVQDRALWITAYYPWWTYYTMNPSELDYSAMTHLVIFSANPVKEPPYLDVLTNPHDSANVVNGLDCGIPSNYLAQTIAKAHAKRVKVLLSVGGIYGPGAKNMSFIASDNARIATFVTGACAFARRQGFDGIELDWEHPYASDREGYVALILRFRRELDQWSPHGLFITAVNHTPWKNLGYDKDAMIAAFDQINPMTYEMHFGDYQHPRTGYNSPIERSTQFSDYGGYALNQPGIGPKAWEAFGIPASKLGLSISFTTTVFSDVVPPVQPGRPYGKSAWGAIREIPRRGRRWDYSSKVPWQASGNTMITYDDTASCRIKVEYAKSLGLGGVMIYELGSGYFPSAPAGQRDILLRSVAASVQSTAPLLGDITPPPVTDKIPPTVSIVTPAAGGTVSGTVQFVARAVDNVGITLLQFIVDGKNFGREIVDPPYTSMPLNTWLIGNGEHTLTVVAQDEAANVGTANISFTVRNTGRKPQYKNLVIYDDELRAPFVNISWGIKADFGSTSIARNGSKSIKVEYEPFGALWLQMGKYGQESNIDPLSYVSLNFDVYPSSDFPLKVVFSNNVTIEIPIKANRWNTLQIPITFSDPFKSFYLRRDLEGKEVAYFDNIRLVAAVAK